MPTKRQVRKRLYKLAERGCERRGVQPPGPWRWVHGVLYDRDGDELIRQTPDALGMSGLPQKQYKGRSYRPKPAAASWSTPKQSRSSWW